MFHHPGVVIAEPVGGLELRQRVLVEPEFIALLPRARQLKLVEDAEFHDVAPKTACCLRQCISPQASSLASAVKHQFRAAEVGLHGALEWLA